MATGMLDHGSSHSKTQGLLLRSVNDVPEMSEELLPPRAAELAGL